jgi:ABC-type phosphonate transport system ATPase subunit
MMTVAESPNRRLRRELGLPDIPARSRLRVDTWIGLNTGDRVREHDGRHEGRVEAILHGAYVKVKWDNGWISDLPLGDVERVRP